jgi:adenylyl- and sulfurtransferase ThiI
VTSREERVARNEELFQEVNRQIEKLEETLGQRETFTILCECSKKHCLDTLEVEATVYQSVRSNPLLFFVEPGHEDLEVERVVEQTRTFLVVEKSGRAAEAVREMRE